MQTRFFFRQPRRQPRSAQIDGHRPSRKIATSSAPFDGVMTKLRALKRRFLTWYRNYLVVFTRQGQPKNHISDQRDKMDLKGVSFGIWNQNDTLIAVDPISS
jgi:hypothetical protein